MGTILTFNTNSIYSTINDWANRRWVRPTNISLYIHSTPTNTINPSESKTPRPPIHSLIYTLYTNNTINPSESKTPRPPIHSLIYTLYTPTCISNKTTLIKPNLNNSNNNINAVRPYITHGLFLPSTTFLQLKRHNCLPITHVVKGNGVWILYKHSFKHQLLTTTSLGTTSSPSHTTVKGLRHHREGSPPSIYAI